MAKLYVQAVPPPDLNKNTEWFMYLGVWTTCIFILFVSWLLIPLHLWLHPRHGLDTRQPRPLCGVPKMPDSNGNNMHHEEDDGLFTDSDPVHPDAWSCPCAQWTWLGRFLREPYPLDLGAAAGTSTRSAGGHQGRGLDLAALYQGRSELAHMAAAVLHELFCGSCNQGSSSAPCKTAPSLFCFFYYLLFHLYLNLYHLHIFPYHLYLNPKLVVQHYEILC